MWSNAEERFMTIFIIILTIGLIFEMVILSIAFFGADEVNCNLLWCEFKTTRTYVQDNVSIITNRGCFRNGLEIDCEDFHQEMRENGVYLQNILSEKKQNRRIKNTKSRGVVKILIMTSKKGGLDVKR